MGTPKEPEYEEEEVRSVPFYRFDNDMENIVGRIMGSEKYEGRTTYHIDLGEKRGVVSVGGAVLVKKLHGLKNGQLIRIVYLGERETWDFNETGHTYKDYNVFKLKEKSKAE